MTIPSSRPDHDSSEPEGERIKRPQPAREGPERHPMHSFRRNQGAPAAAPAEPARRTVESAVETAYRVYEDYVRWGQQAAAQRPRAQDWSNAMGPKPLDPRDPRDPVWNSQQWLSLWQDAYKVWLSCLTPFMASLPNLSSFPQGPGAAPGIPFPPGPEAAVSPSVELGLELETSQRARVSLHLVRKSTGLLKAHLHREEGEGRLMLEFDAAQLSIKLPDAQPAGTYSGVVRDSQGEQAGMLTVFVFEAAKKRV
jgi:hypothetical protein